MDKHFFFFFRKAQEVQKNTHISSLMLAVGGNGFSRTFCLASQCILAEQKSTKLRKACPELTFYNRFLYVC